MLELLFDDTYGLVYRSVVGDEYVQAVIILIKNAPQRVTDKLLAVVGEEYRRHGECGS
jgi:hypothetical protein